MSHVLTYKEQIIKNVRLYLSCHFSIDEAFRKVALSYEGEIQKELTGYASFLERGLLPSAVLLSQGFITKQESVLLAAGEMSGYLEASITQIEELIKKEKEIKQICIQALLYPIIILILTSCLVCFLLFFIFPQVIPIFNSFGQSLPLATRALLFIYNGLQNTLWYIVSGVFVFVTLFYFYKKWWIQFLKQILLRILCKTPLLKTCFIEYSCALWARHISLMSKSGVPIKDIFALAAEITNHPSLIGTSLRVVENLDKGISISAAFGERIPVIKDIKNIISAAEETGKLGECFMQVSLFYEEKVSITIKKLTVILEPLLLVLMGGCVGIIAYAMVAPMYQLTSHIAH